METKIREIKVTPSVDNKIELINSITEVSSNIRDVIGRDFTLSKLDEVSKQYVIEMTNNAFLSRNILKTIRNKSTIWTWDVKKNDWVKRSLTNDEKDYISGLMDRCFDTYMNRIYMINILNRNVAMNHLIQKITQVKDEEESEETKLDSITKRVKERMGVEESK